MHSFAIVTIHPRFIESYLQFGPIHRALTKNLVGIEVCNLRDFSVDKHASVDDKPYGGGEGMVMRPEPLRDAVQSLSPDRELRHVVVSAAGAKKFTQGAAARFSEISRSKKIIFISGRFSGIDQRFIDRYADEELSLGPYVLSGGELASLTMLDATVRLVEGSLGNFESALHETGSQSFSGNREYPLYTRPDIFEEIRVPEELLCGDPIRVQGWRQKNLRTNHTVE